MTESSVNEDHRKIWGKCPECGVDEINITIMDEGLRIYVDCFGCEKSYLFIHGKALPDDLRESVVWEIQKPLREKIEAGMFE